MYHDHPQCLESRLALYGVDTLSGKGGVEAPMSHLHAAKAAARLRDLLAEMQWEERAVATLNGALMDNLPRELLEGYIECLRHLHCKIPELCDSRGLTDGQGSRKYAGHSLLRAAITKPFAVCLSDV